MEAASPVNASAKLAGKEKIVELATSKFINACLAALIMDITISKPALASANVTGLVTTVLKLFAVWIAGRTESANRRDAVATPAGQELCANN